MTRTRTAFAVVALPLITLAGAVARPATAEAVRVDLKAVKIDHAKAARFEPGDLGDYVHARTGILECYREELARDRGAHGRIVVRVTLIRSGDVVDVAILKSEMNPRLADCVTNLMSAWQTPFRPEQPITIEFPLVFTPE
jgi:TonB family protein